MNVTGFPWIYPMAMSLVIFAGSMEFVTVNLLLGAFDPIGALMLTLMVNARHLFYGLAMLEKYRNTGCCTSQQKLDTRTRKIGHES